MNSNSHPLLKKHLQRPFSSFAISLPIIQQSDLLQQIHKAQTTVHNPTPNDAKHVR